MRRLIIIATLALTACATPAPEPRIEYRTANVAVATGCVKGAPADVVPLKQRIPDDRWSALAPGAKAEAMKAQAGARLNYEDQLRAATSGCKPIK